VIAAAAMEVFARSGYDRATIEAIAGRAGVSAPVVYDHFASKHDLFVQGLERTRDELLTVWRTHLAGDAPASERVPAAIDAWAAYVEAHPFAARVFFREPSGDEHVRAAHATVRAEAQQALGAILGREPGSERIAGADPEALQMAAEIIRSGLGGLAVWWSEHPHVPRAQVVAAAVNVIWIGLERVTGEQVDGGNAARR